MQRDLTREAGTPIGGRFWVDEVLGRGSTGVLYRVRDANSGGLFALKCCGTRDAEQARRQRAAIEREFHSLARMAHASILEVYECGVDECGSYYTMELLDGLGEGKLAWGDACAVLCDVSVALALLHSRGLLHGDVSRDNLGRDVRGRVKLRDYGAMRCMGARADLQGTPAFVAPEVVQLQPLDARADLFSLGALGYSLLTGRDAFIAHELEGLRDAWRSEVTRPSRFAEECPAALERLVLRLLSLGRSARPLRAGDVLQELQAIAGTPAGERSELGAWTLVTPPLAGRDQALIDVRLCVLSLLGGTGGTLLIEGPVGCGRSRMLDACVVEGKLLGATVLRVDARDGAAAPFGAARALCLQLLPELATQFKGFARQALGRVIAGVQAGEGSSSGLASLDRDLVLRELRDLLLALSRGQRLVLAVDDADGIDEPSAALFALLAQKTDEHGLLLALTAERRGAYPDSAAMGLLRSMAAASIELAPLSRAHTGTLLCSIFGDGPSLEGAADLVQRLGHGEPRTTLALLQDWVDSGQARHEVAGWVLPTDATGLPETLASVLRARLAAVSPDSRKLAVALSLAQDDPIGLCDYVLLTEHRDFGRVVRSLLDLVEHRVLIGDGERYRFTDPEFLPLLRELPSGDGAEHRRVVHAALAELLDRSKGNPSRRAYHLLGACREREGIELLSQVETRIGLQPLAFYEQALETAERLGLPMRWRHGLRRKVLAKALADLAVERYRLAAAASIAQLERASGLAVWRQSPGGPVAERRSQALECARCEHDAAEFDERIGSPDEALQELLRLYVDICGLAFSVYDVDLLDMLPSFERVVGFATQLDALGEFVQGCRQALCGGAVQAMAAYERALALLSEPAAPAPAPASAPAAAPAEDDQRALRMAVRYHFGLLLAGIGSRTAEQQAYILEAHRECRDRAFQVRARLHASQGNVVEARKWHRRHELSRLQRGGEGSQAATDAGFELLASAFMGDPPAIERALPAIARLAENHRGWRCAWCLGECHRHWLQGDLAGAIEALGPALDPDLAGRHPHYGYAVAAHVVLLCEQDKARDAVARGRAYERLCHKAQVGFGDRWLRQGLAYALARSGKHEASANMIGQVIEQLEGVGIAGLALGSAYEIRAKVALYSGDREAFQRAAKRCSDAYLATNNPAMSGKVAVLTQEAADYQAKELA